MTDAMLYSSRRGVICVRNGAVASSQPLSTEMGLELLRLGGNAADAAIAVAAGLSLTQPTSTGLGGDVFCLFYDAATKTVKALNGSGRSPAALTLQRANDDGFNEANPFPQQHGHAVTVPGAAAAWVDTITNFGSGKVTLSQILQPAISLAENGFPVTQTTAEQWKSGESLLTNSANIYGGDMLIDGKAPKWGEVFRNQHLADTLRTLATGGKAAFYEGPIADAIVAAVGAFGGVMVADDLRTHASTLDAPISVDYKGLRLWECPPNGQGVVALMTLNILEPYDLKSMGHNTVAYLHTLIEAMRLSFADGAAYVADPSVVPVPTGGMLSKEYAATRRPFIDPNRAMTTVPPGDPWPYNPAGKDTVYFTVVDGDGNACSFINSNYQGFGTGIVPQGCGFTLQNRGANFSFVPGHPNVLAPVKRPYHTIIPAMITDSLTGDLLCSYGVMGGFMQPQGHVQVLLNMFEFGMQPQEAIDQARFCIGDNDSGERFSNVSLEDGITSAVIDGLRAMGHDVVGPVVGMSRSLFGWGQVITKGAWWKADENDAIVDDRSVFWIGVDPRSDGAGIGY